MEKLNIPIYRAERIDSREYVIGYLEEHNPNDFYISLLPNKLSAYMINITTLAIHFPSMLDSQGNKIFASLKTRGGSVIIDKSGRQGYVIFCKFKNKPVVVGLENSDRIISNFFNKNLDFKKFSKVIGIQK